MNNFIIDKLNYYGKNCRSRIAIKFKNEYITYGELMKETDIIAKKIKKRLGNEEKVPIIIYMERGIEFIKNIIAILKCNCYYVPMEKSFPIERIKRAYNELNARFIITNSELDIAGVNVILPSKEKLENITLECSVSDKDLVYVIYTSGTTGRPKGVQIMYKNLKNLLISLGDILYNKFTEKINVGVMAAFSFDASVKQIYASLYYGHTLVIAEDSTRNFGRKIHKFHNDNDLSVCDGTPSHLKLMIMQKAKEYSKIPYLLIGGENLKWRTLRDYKEKIGYIPQIINVYGPTECCVDVTYKIIDKIDEETGSVPIGIPLKNTILKIVDSNDNEIKEPNVAGELCILGEQVGAGYTNIEDKAFVKDEYGDNYMYRTGDLAMYTDMKEMVIISRIDRQVKFRGYRIELDEISSFIENYTKCQCVVQLISHDDMQELVAFICNYEKNDSLLEYLEKRLPHYMMPKEFVNVEKIELTNNGKIDEKKLLSLYEKYLM